VHLALQEAQAVVSGLAKGRAQAQGVVSEQAEEWQRNKEASAVHLALPEDLEHQRVALALREALEVAKGRAQAVVSEEAEE